MTRDQLLTLATLTAGAALVAFGSWAYVGKSAGKHFKTWIALDNPYLTKSSVMLLLPGGIGLTLFGIAFTIGKNAVTEEVLVAGLGFMTLGWVLYFFHPRWVQPRWMRRL